MNNMRTCSECCQTKSLNEYHRAENRPQGRKTRCKICQCAAARSRYSQNRDSYLAQSKAYKTSNRGQAIGRKYRKKNKVRINRISREWQKIDRKRNPEKWLVILARRRAREKGLPFSLKATDVVIPKFCPALGIPLKLADGCPNDNSPSLDRIIPDLGYVPENVIVVSRKANAMKQNATLNELERLVDFYRTIL